MGKEGIKGQWSEKDNIGMEKLTMYEKKAVYEKKKKKDKKQSILLKKMEGNHKYILLASENNKHWTI